MNSPTETNKKNEIFMLGRKTRTHCLRYIRAPMCAVEAVRIYKIFIYIHMTCLSHLSENALTLLNDIMAQKTQTLELKAEARAVRTCACLCAGVTSAKGTSDVTSEQVPQRCHEQISRKTHTLA